jgi:Type ISP C-terminal specificity domain/N-6 DNA Methylase
VIHHDTNYTKTDRPDWRIEDSSTYGVFCFGDHKSLTSTGPFQPTAAEQKQIGRYLALGRPVFVFDGIEFIFYKDNLASATRSQIIPKPLNHSADWSAQFIDISAESQFRDVLANPGFRKWTETQLVQQLANRARTVADEMASLLNAPTGSGSSSAEEQLLLSLHDLRETIANHHDPSLRDDKACADFVAQVLTFGLFYAHTRHTKSLTDPTARQAAIKHFWSNLNLAKQPTHLRPFKTIVLALQSSLSSKNILSDWYQEILAVLAHAEYMGTEAGPQDFHSLFERFLTTFDEQARFDRGAFYTPRVLTDWIARATDVISRSDFGLPIMEAAERIIDPCCGTGGFLEAIYLLRSKIQTKQPSLIGFEILPAPYALAHYRLAELFEGDPNPPQLNIVLTDTLADQLLGPSAAGNSGFEEELNDAILFSTPPLRLVIGNPPSSKHAASSAARTVIEKKLDAFRPPKKERTDRQNTQMALNNEAYRFLRWCAEKALESGRGILALVMPGAFARSVSFQYARKWLADNFQKIYILEVDGDARSGDAAQSVFSVLQGRLVILGIRDGNGKHTGAKLFHHDISGLPLASKLAFLASAPKPGSFSSITLIEPQWRFAPSAAYPVDLWLKGWPLTTTTAHLGIFLQKCSAVKLAPTAMLFHTQKPILLRRSIALSKENSTYESLLARWFRGQRKPPAASKLTPTVKSALALAANSQELAPYLFRPFVHGTVLNSDQLFVALKATKGSGVRARPEVRSAFQRGAIGLAIAPAPSDLGATLTRFVCFAWSLPDNDIAARGNAMIYCDRFPEKNSVDKNILIDNVSEALMALFEFSVSPAKAVVFYTYAVLSCPTYLEKFEGVLYSPSNPSAPPRVLIASDAEHRKELATLGEKIAECEKPDYVPNAIASLSLLWPSSIIEFSLVDWTYLDDANELKLLGDNDEVIVFAGVPLQVVALRIAGHTVIDKWLRERTTAYLTRKFTETDAGELQKLICAICDQIPLIAAADNLVKEIIDSESLVTPVAAP